jgi:hypothetical protein
LTWSGANKASASSIEPTVSPFKFNTSTFAIVFFLLAESF